MIAHVSIPSKTPKNTALFLAAVINGVVFEFPVVPGAWIAVSKDRSGLAIDPSVRPKGPTTMPLPQGV